MKNLLKTATLICAFLLTTTQNVFAQGANSNFENSALIIIDVQNDYFPGGTMTLVNADAAGQKTQQLLAAYRANNRPVIHIQHIATEPGATFFLPNTPGAEINSLVAPAAGEKVIVKHYHIKHIATDPGATFFLPNTPGAEINPIVAPTGDEKVITKHYPNSFRETDLQQYLQSKGIKNLVITGMMTDVCVDATVRAAMDLGYSNTVIGDACATRNRELYGETVNASDVHESFLAGMAALDNLYAKVLTTNQYLNK